MSTCQAEVGSPWVPFHHTTHAGTVSSYFFLEWYGFFRVFEWATGQFIYLARGVESLEAQNLRTSNISCRDVRCRLKHLPLALKVMGLRQVFPEFFPKFSLFTLLGIGNWLTSELEKVRVVRRNGIPSETHCCLCKLDLWQTLPTKLLANGWRLLYKSSQITDTTCFTDQAGN